MQDDADIEREIKSLFVRCNILINRFKHCLGKLKLNCFKHIAYVCITQAYGTRSIRQLCIDFIHVTVCVKRFFGFAKYSSLTLALLLTGLPSCTTVIHNFNFRFRILISTSTNVIVKSFECV